MGLCRLQIRDLRKLAIFRLHLSCFALNSPIHAKTFNPHTTERNFCPGRKLVGVEFRIQKQSLDTDSISYNSHSSNQMKESNSNMNFGLTFRVLVTGKKF